MVIPGGAVAIDGVKSLVQKMIMSATRSSIEAWSKRRAEEFFETFCRHVADPQAIDADIGIDLNNVLGSDTAQQVLFDAYRFVCACRSRLLGPRVIASRRELALNAELLLRGLYYLWRPDIGSLRSIPG